MRTLAALALALIGITGLAPPARAAAHQSLIEAPGPAGPLKGALLTPEDGAAGPVVLIIPGSGPTDRDGDNFVGIKAAPYRLLAEALAAQGVTTARIDKRGMFASAAAVADPNRVTITDYAADAHAWAAMLKVRTGAPCVWLLGHSEGALVALAAAQTPADLCGLVLVAGAGRPMAEILRDQLKANPANAPLLDQALPAIDRLQAGQHVDVSALNPMLAPLFRPQVQDFLIDEMRYDPARLAAAYPGPILVVQGTTDLQVGLADAERLAGARPGITLLKLEGVNHVLKTAPPERPANLATYFDSSLPLAPGVAGPIAAFVKTR